MGMTKRLFEELSCEERFELDAQCDIWQADAIAAQDADMVAEEMARQSDALIAEDAERDLLMAELAYILPCRKSLRAKDLRPGRGARVSL